MPRSVTMCSRGAPQQRQPPRGRLVVSGVARGASEDTAVISRPQRKKRATLPACVDTDKYLYDNAVTRVQMSWPCLASAECQRIATPSQDLIGTWVAGCWRSRYFAQRGEADPWGKRHRQVQSFVRSMTASLLTTPTCTRAWGRCRISTRHD